MTGKMLLAFWDAWMSRYASGDKVTMISVEGLTGLVAANYFYTF